MIIFYHYPHCPFCQRVRLALGILNISYQDTVLSYADEITPVRLIGKKMLPIITIDENLAVGESLDIIRILHDQCIKNTPLGDIENVSQWAFSFAGYIDIILPYYLDHSSEWEVFPEGAEYFRKKKEAKRGKTLEQMKHESEKNFHEIRPAFEKIFAKIPKSGFLEGDISLADAVLTADISGLTLVPKISLPKHISEYIQRVELAANTKLFDR